VPVVCVTGAFTLTPMFAHNQSAVLNQLLSPADALPYNANINVNNVEVTQSYVRVEPSAVPSTPFRVCHECCSSLRNERAASVLNCPVPRCTFSRCF
jgi:hypothetical protein